LNKFVAAFRAPTNLSTFSVISGIIFEVNMVAEQKQALLETIFCCFL